MREAFKIGLRFGAVTLAVEALAVLPGRITLAREQLALGRSPFELTIAGVLRDVSDLALPVGLIVLVVLALTAGIRAWRKTSRPSGSGLVALLAMVGVLLWFVSSAAAEFKVQRGVDATWFDLEVASGSSSILQTFFGFVSLRRHLVPGAFAIAATAALLAVARRSPWEPVGREPGRAARPRDRLALLGGFAVATGLGFVTVLVPLDPHVRVFRTVTDRHAVGEPFPSLFANLGRSQENVRLGMRGLIERAHFSPAQSEGGEALLGLPRRRSPDVDCRVHPLARSFPNHGVEPPRESADGHRELRSSIAEALRLVDRISEELYVGRATSLDVVQVMMESFRADDIHELSTVAPAKLAPFMDSLYASARAGEGGVIAFKHAWQAGARTSQGLSAYLCGLGTMPYGLSVTRDFGPLPLRCLPDVLALAGFEGRFFTGNVPSFDRMDVFFLQHGVRHVVGTLQLPANAPTSEGGVSDRAVADFIARTLRTNTSDRPRYVLWLSGSNHVPYRAPDDLPAEITQRVAELTDSSGGGFNGSEDDAKRLRTFAYADLAFSELYAKLGENLARTILVYGADHSTPEEFLWHRTDDGSRDVARAHIPMVIVLPEPLLASAAHPDTLRSLVRELNVALDAHPWSQNDLPLILLTLLGHAPGLAALPTAERWHTMGGQRTSPYFRGPTDDVDVMGINCFSELFGVDDLERSKLPHEVTSFVRNASEIYTVGPTLIPIAAHLSHFLNGYVTTCRTPLR